MINNHLGSKIVGALFTVTEILILQSTGNDNAINDHLEVRRNLLDCGRVKQQVV